jgi:hypothetical protein
MPPKNSKTAHLDPTHINLMSQNELNFYLLNSGFDEIIPICYPKTYKDKKIISALNTIIFTFFPMDFLSGTSSAIAIKKKNGVKRLHNKYSFHIDKLLNI